MTNFKELFSFSKKEIDMAFSQATVCNQRRGLKLLQAKPEDKPIPFGKMLIVIPAKVGTANKRNLIKRRLKAVFYEEKLFEKSRIYIMLVYKPAVDLSFEQLKEFLVQSLCEQSTSKDS